ncbi:MAG: efflux RND transporter permease subunit, partial [Gammaproteobacteria bacterium]
GPGAEARNSIGTVLVAGMSVGTLFTLFVVPVFYSLIAAQRRPDPTHEAKEHAARSLTQVRSAAELA